MAGQVTLKFLTYNIRGPWDRGANAWENRRAGILSILRDEAPHVFGTQEGVQWQLDELAAALPEWDSVGVGRDDGKQDGEQCAIWFRRDEFDLKESSTFWLSDTPEVPASMSWDTACTRICTSALLDGPLGQVRVWNCHTDHISAEARLRGTELILNRIANGQNEPTVLMGDFNEGEQGDVLRLALSRGMIETFRAIHPDAAEVCTYTDFDPSMLVGEKIDYIFCSEHFDVVDASIIRTTMEGRQPSDHFPVTALLQTKPSSEERGLR